VQITVNRNGIAAKYTKGTTNTILLGRTSIGNSQKVQMATDADAPETQIGFITVNFKLERNLF
jgi:hypothetical protein